MTPLMSWGTLMKTILSSVVNEKIGFDVNIRCAMSHSPMTIMEEAILISGRECLPVACCFCSEWYRRILYYDEAV